MTQRLKRNDPIGEVECPYKGCSQVCKVFKFRPRTPGRHSVFAGKLYADCPVHGRIGNDGNPATQEHYLEKATIWGAKRPENTAGNPQPPAVVAAPKQVPKNPQSSPERRPEPSPKIPATPVQKTPSKLWSPPWD